MDIETECSRGDWYDHFDEETGLAIDSTCAKPTHRAALDRRRDRGEAWHSIVRGRDGGGVRDFLDGKPIHCGSGLELQSVESRGDEFGEWIVRLPKGTRVRYEMAWGGERVAVLHVDVGGHEFVGKVDSWMRFRWLASGR